MLIQLFNDILTISIKSVPFILILMIVTVLFQKKLHPQVVEFIWILVFIRLVIPQALPFEISLISNNQEKDKIMLVESFSDYYVEDKTKPLEILKPHTGSQVRTNSLNLNIDDENKILNLNKYIISIVWLLVSLILILCTAVKSYLIKISIRNNKSNKIVSKEIIPVIESNKVNYPIIFGCFKSVIYVPKKLWNILNTKEKEYVLSHENQHHKRKDILTGWLYYLVLCIHWFNPLVWGSFRLIQNLKEISCDRQVINNLTNRDFINYAKTLLKVGELCSSNYSTVSIACFAGKSSIRRRLEMIISKKNIKLKWSIMTAMLIMVVGLMFLTDPFSLGYYKSKAIGKEKAFNRYIYRTKYRFKTDKDLIGTWLLVGNIQEINTFDEIDPDYIKYNGESYYIIKDDGSTSFNNTWTKGLILNKSDNISLEYTIKNIRDKQYLFIENYEKIEINKSFNSDYSVYIKYSNEQFKEDLYIPSQFNKNESFSFPDGTITRDMTVTKVIEILGKPLMYKMFGNTSGGNTQVETLPESFYMDYGPYIINFYEGHLKKIIIKDATIEYKGIKIGYTEEEVFSILNKPLEIIDSQVSEYKDNVLYKNIGGREGYHYYNSPEENIAIYFVWYKVEIIVTGF